MRPINRVRGKRWTAKTQILQERWGANARRTSVRPPAPHFPAPKRVERQPKREDDGREGAISGRLARKATGVSPSGFARTGVFAEKAACQFPSQDCPSPASPATAQTSRGPAHQSTPSRARRPTPPTPALTGAGKPRRRKAAKYLLSSGRQGLSNHKQHNKKHQADTGERCTRQGHQNHRIGPLHPRAVTSLQPQYPIARPKEQQAEHRQRQRPSGREQASKERPSATQAILREPSIQPHLPHERHPKRKEQHVRQTP